MWSKVHYRGIRWNIWWNKHGDACYFSAAFFNSTSPPLSTAPQPPWATFLCSLYLHFYFLIFGVGDFFSFFPNFVNCIFFILDFFFSCFFQFSFMFYFLYLLSIPLFVLFFNILLAELKIQPSSTVIFYWQRLSDKWQISTETGHPYLTRRLTGINLITYL
jgi:hypothetical protein